MIKATGNTRIQLNVSPERIDISVGTSTASLARDHLGAMIRLLKVARDLEAGSVTTDSPVPEVTATSRRPVGRPPGGGTYQRSRKPVGKLVQQWMEENPGWHSERQLLKAVKDNQMTDANPKRALMIALGRGRDKIFQQDGRKRWRLLSEGLSTGPATRKTRKTKGDADGGPETRTRVIRRKKGEARGLKR